MNITRPRNHQMTGIEIEKVRAGVTNTLFAVVRWESTKYPGKFVSSSAWLSAPDVNALIAELAG